MPPLDADPWPTLGPGVCDWAESELPFGPGDLADEPHYIMDSEKIALTYRAYEVYPYGHERAGKRRFQTVVVSLPKGLAKTEWAAMICGAELSPDGPVRFSGTWRRQPHPKCQHTAQRTLCRWCAHPEGRPVTDPYIPMMAYTEEQSDELAFAALRRLLMKSPSAGRYDIGLDRILRIGKNGAEAGKAVTLAQSPNARDGARTTFQFFDEPHRLVLPTQKRAHTTMEQNLSKRPIAEPWQLKTGTAYQPGQGSVAEDDMNNARQTAGSPGAARSPMFFFHREASGTHDIQTASGLRAAIREASGPSATDKGDPMVAIKKRLFFRDTERIAANFEKPGVDIAYVRRVWLNQLVTGGGLAFDTEHWRTLARRDYAIPRGALVTLGFDGSRTKDSTALVATEVATGHQSVTGHWQDPLNGRPWEVDTAAVDQSVRDAFERWEVWRMYADPWLWMSELAAWAGTFGEKRVFHFHTNRGSRIGPALHGYRSAMDGGDLTHDGNAEFALHIGAAYKQDLGISDDDGKRLWTVTKERPDSPFKIDLAMAGCLAWAARLDAVAAGANTAPAEVRVTRL